MTTTALGQRLRKLYVDQLGFLPTTLRDDNILYIRSAKLFFNVDFRTTSIPRTIESMAQVFTGLYPGDYLRAIPNFHIRLVNLENLFPNNEFCALVPNLA